MSKSGRPLTQWAGPWTVEPPVVVVTTSVTIETSSTKVRYRGSSVATASDPVVAAIDRWTSRLLATCRFVSALTLLFAMSATLMAVVATSI